MADDPSLISLYSIDINKIPRNLSILSLDANTLELKWDNPLDITNLSGYRIFSAYTRDLIYKNIGETVLNSYIISGITQENYYYLTVQSLYTDGLNPGRVFNDQFGTILFGFDFFGDVPDEPIVSGYVAPTSPELVPPINLIATSDYSVNPPNIILNWTPPITTGITISGYRIWHSTNFESTFASIGSTQSSGYIHSGVDSNLAHYYRITSLY